jgi:hypothetical protein
MERIFSLFPGSLIIYVTDCYPVGKLVQILRGLTGHIPAGELLCALWKNFQVKCIKGFWNLLFLILLPILFSPAAWRLCFSVRAAYKSQQTYISENSLKFPIFNNNNVHWRKQLTWAYGWFECVWNCWWYALFLYCICIVNTGWWYDRMHVFSLPMK